MSVVVDVTNTVGLRAAGLRALNKELGNDGAKMFIDQFFGGIGDYTAEKKLRPPMTDAELNELMELAKGDAE